MLSLRCWWMVGCARRVSSAMFCCRKYGVCTFDLRAARSVECTCMAWAMGTLGAAGERKQEKETPVL